MKPFFTACAILLVLFAASIANCYAITDLTEEIDHSLTLSQNAARQEDWAGADAALARAREGWQHSDAYLHMVVSHDELDEAESLFAELGQYALQRDKNKYCTSSACLSVQLSHIQETQRFSLQNVF